MSYSKTYSFVDKALHYFAFSAPFVQKALADLETDLFRKRLKDVESTREVFVTGLPRAGTTLVLELLYQTGEFATFTYRDMPFVLAPLLWEAVSRRFRTEGSMVERAHGDGMLVSFDSPEAFEEVIWLTFLGREIVHEHTLVPLTRESISAEFVDAMRNSVRKLLARARESKPAQEGMRYLSKNNANISRIEALSEIFPSSKVVIVFRDPAAHVASLMHQHQRFLAEHEQDAFSRRYMRWIGHYEFGKNLKPIDFDGWLDGATAPPQADANFWLRYWCAAYGYALAHRTANVCFIDFDRLLQDRRLALGRIARELGIADSQRLIESAETLRATTTRRLERGAVASPVWEQACRIHAQLQIAAL